MAYNSTRFPAMVGAARHLPRSLILNTPNEILQGIAGFLPTDGDVINLSLSCKEMHDRILGPSTGIWRHRYEAKYDIPEAKTMDELGYEYKARAIVLSQRMDFRAARVTKGQQLWLEVIYTMLVESLTVPQKSTGPKTYNRIREVMSQTRFLNRPRKPKPCEFTCAIQLCLTALALHKEVSEPCLRSEYELAIVYSFGSEPVGPYIPHDNLDLTKILHIRSFWQRHLLDLDEMTYYITFSYLDEDHKPKMRKSYGIDESQLSSSWLGYYSCLHFESVPGTRAAFNKSTTQTCADIESHLRLDILSMNLHITNDPFWPSECNKIIPMSTDMDTNRVFFQGIQGINGLAGEGNPVFGFTEIIAYPYGGIPGWNRVCFAIIAGGNDEYSSDWLHGYEAVLLPGGRIMLGRWIDLKNTSGRGPFIFWDVEIPSCLQG